MPSGIVRPFADKVANATAALMGDAAPEARCCRFAAKL
jgi:hypothetical protein